MAKYIYSVTTIKYGTVTGLATMPATLVQLPDTVKGSIAIDESEGAYVEHYVDQKKEPIVIVKVEEGVMSITAQFNDWSFDKIAAMKGGTGVTGAAGSWTPSTGYTNINKAIEIIFDSGQKLEIYNANCSARQVGGGGRDKLLAWELKIKPQITANELGSYKWSDV